MSSPYFRSFPLLPHPWTSCPWVQGLQVDVEFAGDHLRIRYVLKGQLERLDIPSPGPLREGDRLWEHTCFELFIAQHDRPEYREFNFAPSRAWATQFLSGYRQRTPVSYAGSPLVDVRRTPDSLTMDVGLPLAAMPGAGPWKLALAAVVEAKDGTRTYWALNHGPGRPDFHQPEGFAVELPGL